jgi:glycosyltransferase involved in cell wall biosynthesis
MNETRNNIAVSICCLTYNHEGLIRDALKGFLMQETNFPFEIVIHDDASTDGTQAIIREYQAAYPDLIRPIFQTENQLSKTGVYPFWTELYPAARGKYIAECDGDDYWTDPQKLQKQFDFLEANPDYAMCHHDYLIMEMASGEIHQPSLQLPRDFTAAQLIGFDEGPAYGVHTSAKMWRNVYRDASPEQRRFIEGFWGDYPINTLMGMYGACKYIPGIKPSIFRRGHASSSWTTMPTRLIQQKTRDMQKRLNVLILQTGNAGWIKIRRGR